MINVTKTFLPPQREYQSILKRAWDSGWVTNRGHLVLELEEKLKTYLGVNFMTLMTNGTLPIQIAIKALNLSGEIITTPFSYVATTSSIVWESCKPVFVDIHPEFLTIDERQIEAAITNRTTAILATHVFGNPCHVEAIEIIAKKYGIKVIYDAAHCFGVKYKDQSLFNYGDVSTTSFHATKIFHTGEGGAIFSNDQSLHDKLYYHHNFGHDGTEAFYGIGINAKMSELQAAMGLSIIPYIEKIFQERKSIVALYNDILPTHGIQKLKLRAHTDWNYCYYPVIFQNETVLKRVKEALELQNIFPRRYFYPSLNQLPYINMESDCATSKQVASSILCLPLYVGLAKEHINRISEVITKNL